MNIKSNRKAINASRPVSRPMARRPITAATKITADARNRRVAQKPVNASFAALTPEKQAFARQLQANMRRNSSVITAATNTTNIMAKPDFVELLPMFVQKLLVLDLYGSVAMKSRQQLVPYFKFVAESTKGETSRGDILNSPFVNRQGLDPNFGGRLIKNESVAISQDAGAVAYTPILPGTVTAMDGTTVIGTDTGMNGTITNGSVTLTIDYSSGAVEITSGSVTNLVITYQYDNENVGPRNGYINGDYGYDYGAQMGKGYLQLDEFNLVAEAHQLACYWSIYAAFAANTEYGANIADMAKESALSELTAEINTQGFQTLEAAAQYQSQFNWDAAPVMSASVVPTDYLQMFKLKLADAAAYIYQKTRLTRPNRLSVGTRVANYLQMINGFRADNVDDTVGPYKFGSLDQWEIYVNPSMDPNKWVMSCKSNDIRRNSGLFGEYMPLTSTDPITLANASVQQGSATMYAMKVVNPDTVVSGKIVGTY